MVLERLGKCQKLPTDYTEKCHKLDFILTNGKSTPIKETIALSIHLDVLLLSAHCSSESWTFQKYDVTRWVAVFRRRFSGTNRRWRPLIWKSVWFRFVSCVRASGRGEAVWACERSVCQRLGSEW